jgi:hypothetical protein
VGVDPLRERRPHRFRLAANGVLGIATSVRWKPMCFAWGKTFASISTGFTCKLVGFQLRIDRGNASCCREFPCLFANLIDRVASVLARRVAAAVIGPRVSCVERRPEARALACSTPP